MSAPDPTSPPAAPEHAPSPARGDRAQPAQPERELAAHGQHERTPRAFSWRRLLFPHGATASFGSVRAWAVFAAVIVAGIALDLATKWWAFEHVAGVPAHPDAALVLDLLAADPSKVGYALPPHDAKPAIPGLLDFVLVLNPGAVFGTGPGQRWAFIGFTALTLALGVYAFACWTKPRHWLTHVALALVIAGGIGNLYDRATLGVVRDFLHFFPGASLPFGLRWPGGSADLWPYISNVADKFVLIGIAVLVVKLWRADPNAGPDAGPNANPHAGAAAGQRPGHPARSPGAPAANAPAES